MSALQQEVSITRVGVTAQVNEKPPRVAHVTNISLQNLIFSDLLFTPLLIQSSKHVMQ
jgi:hypothetical protein